MNISEGVKQKIVTFILNVNFNHRFRELPSKGVYTIESGFELAENKKMPNYVFVICDKITYKNYSIHERGYGVYAFDAKTGELDKNFEKNKKCYLGFFEDIVVLEQIV